MCVCVFNFIMLKTHTPTNQASLSGVVVQHKEQAQMLYNAHSLHTVVRGLL